MQLIVYGPKLETAPQNVNHLYVPDLATALDQAVKLETEEVLLCKAELLESLAEQLRPPEADLCDLIHTGLLLGGYGTFSTAQLISTDWFFLDPDPHVSAISWKATPAICWFRPGSMRELGGLDAAYRSPTSSLMDIAYRLLLRGGRVRHEPGWISEQYHIIQPPLTVPLVDEFLFLLRHTRRRAAFFAAFWHVVISKRVRETWHALREAIMLSQRIPAPSVHSPQEASYRLMGSKRRQVVNGFSAIIPTINRYDYLPQAVESLMESEPKPSEIIIVDQTPLESRQKEIYDSIKEKYDIIVIYLDEAGQSRSRNIAIQKAKEEWLLLFEDDVAAWEHMTLQHVRAVELSGADGSTGVSLAPWKDESYIPSRIRHDHIANVLDTGNCLIRKETVLAVNGLDPAFDRGSGADHDLGVRLYLAGHEIVFNPRAIETHYKASTGGMRTHGAWWRTRSALLGPFPPPTQVYTIQRYYPRASWIPLYFTYYFRAAQHHNALELAWLWISMPWKMFSAVRHARRLR